jgi:hypothetical protein
MENNRNKTLLKLAGSLLIEKKPQIVAKDVLISVY